MTCCGSIPCFDFFPSTIDGKWRCIFNPLAPGKHLASAVFVLLDVVRDLLDMESIATKEIFPRLLLSSNASFSVLFSLVPSATVSQSWLGCLHDWRLLNWSYFGHIPDAMRFVSDFGPFCQANMKYIRSLVTINSVFSLLPLGLSRFYRWRVSQWSIAWFVLPCWRVIICWSAESSLRLTLPELAAMHANSRILFFLSGLRPISETRTIQITLNRIGFCHFRLWFIRCHSFRSALCSSWLAEFSGVEWDGRNEQRLIWRKRNPDWGNWGDSRGNTNLPESIERAKNAKWDWFARRSKCRLFRTRRVIHQRKLANFI
jgi:hypothetical protein